MDEKDRILIEKHVGHDEELKKHVLEHELFEKLTMYVKAHDLVRVPDPVYENDGRHLLSDSEGAVACAVHPSHETIVDVLIHNDWQWMLRVRCNVSQDCNPL